jgi:hypothetical protein
VGECLVTEECGGDRVHGEGVGHVGEHDRRGVVVQPLQHPQQRRADVLGALEADRGVVADQREEVIALVRGEP